jgi:hypothetical protein
LLILPRLAFCSKIKKNRKEKKEAGQKWEGVNGIFTPYSRKGGKNRGVHFEKSTLQFPILPPILWG